MTVTIPANDFGQLRIFALDFAPPEALKEKTAEGIAGAFGVLLNPDYIDVIDTAALSDLTLADYIRQGYDFQPDAADLVALDSLSGWIIIVMSRATDGAGTTLDLAPGLRHVTTIGTPLAMSAPVSMDTDSAKGVLTPTTKVPMSDARIGGMVATLALLVLFVLVALMIFIAG
ncbi:hypothetical protein SAMN04488515_2528 [Cognatiyoonia koreensis]|uniref:Uncharacterized protein n=1 Tax=Cognatiyoonia koreensis TaxID=364200 RepID=A0A1I0RE75_9RHOB|nr:hypothetical protein [Cognatiyoonia koreensis]SEW38910.1 hypothetical protein SAMN04488515_2528 [Cognatiyoonia koreensis]